MYLKEAIPVIPLPEECRDAIVRTLEATPRPPDKTGTLIHFFGYSDKNVPTFLCVGIPPKLEIKSDEDRRMALTGAGAFAMKDGVVPVIVALLLPVKDPECDEANVVMVLSIDKQHSHYVLCKRTKSGLFSSTVLYDMRNVVEDVLGEVIRGAVAVAMGEV